LPQPLEILLKLDETGPVPFNENTKRAGYQQTSTLGFRTPVPFINQEAFGLDREGETDSARSPGSKNSKAVLEGGSGLISHHPLSFPG
jgi:hypothetical protein